MKSRKGQSLSFDAIAAVILFIIVLTVVLVYLNGTGTTTSQDQLHREALVVSQGLIVSSQTSNQSIVQNGQLNISKYIQLRDDVIYDKNGGYAGVKDLLGISSEYCIYLEDANGSLIVLNDGNSSFFGSPNVQVVLTASSGGTKRVACNSNNIPS